MISLSMENLAKKYPPRRLVSSVPLVYTTSWRWEDPSLFLPLQLNTHLLPVAWSQETTIPKGEDL